MKAFFWGDIGDNMEGEQWGEQLIDDVWDVRGGGILSFLPKLFTLIFFLNLHEKYRKDWASVAKPP